MNWIAILFMLEVGLSPMTPEFEGLNRGFDEFGRYGNTKVEAQLFDNRFFIGGEVHSYSNYYDIPEENWYVYNLSLGLRFDPFELGYRSAEKNIIGDFDNLHRRNEFYVRFETKIE